MKFESWNEIKLGDICNYKTGRLNSSAAEINGEYPFFTCSPETMRINSYSFDQDAILLAGNNANGIFPIKRYMGKFNAYQRTYVMSSNNEKIIDNTYLYYYLTFQLNYLKELSIGSATKFLTKKMLDQLPIKYPKYNHMKRIGHILKSIDEKVENNTNIIKNLEKTSQALFKHWFVDFEFSNEDGKPYKSSGGKMIESELGIIPEGWACERLGNIILSIKDSIKRGEVTASKPYVPIDMMPMKKMTFYKSKPGEDAKSSLINFQENDILLGAMRVYFHRVCLAPFDGTTRTTCFVLRPVKEVYLYFSLLTVFQSETIDYAESTSKGTTIPYAVWENGLEDYIIALPTAFILEKFNVIVSPLFEKMRLLSKANETLTNLRDTLLPKLLSEEIELPDDLEVTEDVPVP